MTCVCGLYIVLIQCMLIHTKLKAKFFFFLNVAYVSEPILELQSYRVFEKGNAPTEKRINVVAKHE